MILKRIGNFENFKLKSSFFISQHLHYNLYSYPKLKQIKLIFPFLFKLKKKYKNLIILTLNFLEQLSGQKSIIKTAQIVGSENMWTKFQVTLSGFYFYRFLTFFSEFIEKHPLLVYSYKRPVLRKINYNFFKFYIFDVDLFFPGQMRRNLPAITHYWLELEIKFNSNKTLKYYNNLSIYTQLFLNNIF